MEYSLKCPSQDDTERRKELLRKLKCIVDQIAEEERQITSNMPNPTCAPCCSANQPAESAPKKEDKSCQPPEVMVCYRVKKQQATNAKKAEAAEAKAKKEADIPVKPSKSRELRASILYVGCDCEKRNGLQDDCQRTGCHGSPECLTTPSPTCGPSEFSNGKHLGKKSMSGSSYENDVTGGRGGDGNIGNLGNLEITSEYICFPACIGTPPSA